MLIEEICVCLIYILSRQASPSKRSIAKNVPLAGLLWEERECVCVHLLSSLLKLICSSTVNALFGRWCQYGYATWPHMSREVCVETHLFHSGPLSVEMRGCRGCNCITLIQCHNPPHCMFTTWRCVVPPTVLSCIAVISQGEHFRGMSEWSNGPACVYVSRCDGGSDWGT